MKQAEDISWLCSQILPAVFTSGEDDPRPEGCLHGGARMVDPVWGPCMGTLFSEILKSGSGLVSHGLVWCR